LFVVIHQGFSVQLTDRPGPPEAVPIEMLVVDLLQDLSVLGLLAGEDTPQTTDKRRPPPLAAALPTTRVPDEWTVLSKTPSFFREIRPERFS
jgi:hypothetical protein